MTEPSAKQNYPPYVVYNNLPHLLRNRKLKLVSGFYASASRRSTIRDLKSKSEWLSDTEFIKQIQLNKFIIIEAEDANDKTRKNLSFMHSYTYKLPVRTFIVIIDRSLKDMNSGELDKILIKIPEIKSNKRNFNLEILLIGETLLNIYASKKMNEYFYSGSSENGYIRIFNQIYTLFIDDIFTRSNISPHRILSNTEAENIISVLKINKNQLPKISAKDPISMIIGAEIGDILEIEDVNENSGKPLEYRIVKS